jgi:rootletin
MCDVPLKYDFVVSSQAFNEYYNNEHARLLKMWREVVAMKRLFKEMQSSTKIDLNKIRTDISAANREVAGACNGVTVNLRHANRLEVRISPI